MEVGANLSAEVRNVPPAIAGDLDLTVGQGPIGPRHARDLNAVDPDDDAKDLTFAFPERPTASLRSRARRPSRSPSSPRPTCRAAGCSSSTTAPTRRLASFDVVVADHAGATSGAPQTVKVHVKGP
jgi:hypothetical protein